MTKQRNLDPAHIASLTILDSAEAAAYVRLSPSTMAKQRMLGIGPAFIRQSARKVLYRRADLDAWLTSRAVAVAA